MKNIVVFCVLFIIASGCATIVDGNLAVESLDTYASERLIDFQDGNGQVMVGDTYPHVSSSFFGRQPGLYWIASDVPKVENGALERAYIIYVDKFGQALTIMKLSTSMTWPGLRIKNLTRFDFYFTEEQRQKYNRTYNDFNIPVNITADLVDGNIFEVPAIGLPEDSLNHFGITNGNSIIIYSGQTVDIPAFIPGLFSDIKNLRINEMFMQFYDAMKGGDLSKVNSLDAPLAIQIFSDLLPSHVDIPDADIPYPQFEDIPWFKNPNVAYIQFDHGSLSAVNRITGEKKILLTIDTKWSRNRNGELVVKFSYESLLYDAELVYLEFIPYFYSNQNYFLGNLGSEQIPLGSINNSVISFEKSFKEDSYKFSFYNICIMYEDGVAIKSLQPVGDPRNDFTLLSENAAASSTWMSNPYESYLYLVGNQVVALNLISGEQVPLVKITKSWETKKTNSNSISFENLDGEYVLGGSYFGWIKPENDIEFPLVASFRFDGNDVFAFGYEYIPGSIPKVVFSVEDLKGGVNMYYDIITISFKDGNTRQVFIPRNYVIGY